MVTDTATQESDTTNADEPMTNDHREAVLKELKRWAALAPKDWLVEKSGYVVRVSAGRGATAVSVSCLPIPVGAIAKGTGPYAELLATLKVVNDWLENAKPKKPRKRAHQVGFSSMESYATEDDMMYKAWNPKANR